METLCFCCCSDFLKDRDDETKTEFYDLLGVEKKCTTDEIKKAYKKKALQMHPDKLAQRGIVLTAEDTAKFQQTKDAYEILIQPQKRSRYDKLGKNGFKFFDDLENGRPPNYDFLKNNLLKTGTSTRCNIFLIVILLSSFFWLFPVLFCLEIDGDISSKWSLLMIPIWCLDLFLFNIMFKVVLQGPMMKPEEWDEEIMGEFHDTWPQALLGFLQFVMNLLFQILLVIRLDDVIDWNYIIVCIPLYIWFFFNIFNAIYVLRHVDIFVKRYPEVIEIGENEVKRVIREENHHIIYYNVLRFITLILILCKVDDLIQWSWWLVFIPLWLNLFYSLAKNIYYINLINAEMKENNTTTTNEEEKVLKDALLSKKKFGHVSDLIKWLIFGTFMVLTCARIDGSQFSVFILFIPFFISIGCCLCFACCAIFGVTEEAMEAMEEEEANLERGDYNNADSTSTYEPPVTVTDITANTTSNDNDVENATTTTVRSQPVVSNVVVNDESRPLMSNTPTASPGSSSIDQHESSNVKSSDIDIDID